MRKERTMNNHSSATLKHQRWILLCALSLLMTTSIVSTSCATRLASKLLGHEGDADQTHALKELAMFHAQPAFIAPGPAFDAKKSMAGKSIYRIAGPSSNPWYQQGFNGMMSAAEKVGYHFSACSNEGQLSQYQQCLAEGVKQKASLIDLFAGPNPNDLASEISAAKSAGTLVAVSHNFGMDGTVLNVSANFTVDFGLAARLLADWVISKDVDAHVLVLVSDELPSTAVMRAGITSEFIKYGGSSIKYKFENVSIAQWSTGLKPAVEKAIAEDPELSYIICIYDSMSEFVVPTIAAANLDGQLKVIGFNGTPFVLDMIRAGKVEMTIGECQEWTSYAISDAEMRLIAGMGAVKNMHIPFRIFNKDNAEDAGIPATYGKGYGDTFKADYAKLWGL